MELESLLRDSIKPELNKIYTEPPRRHPGGLDMGFFCREHAYHCYFLCKMLGYDAAIKRGDLTFSFDASFAWTSWGDGADHAWCQASGTLPIDLSVNFACYHNSFNVELVYGLSHRDAYTLSYNTDATEYEQHVNNPPVHPHIAYLERETVAIPPGDLLDDPHRFLIKPPGANGWAAVYGNHIFSSITLHLFYLATGKTQRLTTYKDSQSTARTIAGRYPNAIKDVKGIIGLTAEA
jgi:hypothetical protein